MKFKFYMVPILISHLCIKCECNG